jgi:hypothetical protein
VKLRQALLVAAVAALAGLNAWRWAGSTPDAQQQRNGASTPGISAADFRLKVGAATTSEPPSGARDLFAPKLALPTLRAKVAALPAGLPAAPPAKTPQELAEEAARAEIGQIKLVGVVFRDGKGQAFLVKGEQVFMVQAGARVGERFRVEAISADNVELRDPATHVAGQIPVSGK